jgi:lysophospholipase L1-like esterase
VPVAALVLSLVVGACTAERPATSSSGPSRVASSAMTPPEATLRYVALGDSYTIGTSVTERERWPNQLVARLPRLELVANLGVNGFTSRDLIEVELPSLPPLKPDIVTVLIGVNDVVQGVSVSEYKANLVQILPGLVELVGNDRVLVVTIPDYTVTPQGGSFGDPAQQSGAIREFNALMRQLATGFGITVTDIYDSSLRAATDRSLVASDGLHPSGAQYGLWVDQIAPAMETLLAR